MASSPSSQLFPAITASHWRDALQRREPNAVSQQINTILDHAEFCGNQDDGNGGVIELWNLRKNLGPHPKGSTIARTTLDRLLFGEGGRGDAA